MLTQLFLRAALLAAWLPLCTSITYAAALPSPQSALGRGIHGDSAAGDSGGALFSADSRFLFFQSNARDLVPGDSSLPSLGLYRYELSSGQLTAIRIPSTAPSTLTDISRVAVSADGQRLALGASPFRSTGPKAPSPTVGLYWLDLSTGQSQLVSRNTNSTSADAPTMLSPVLSADGSWIAFESRDTNLVRFPRKASLLPKLRSIYLHNTATREIQLINPIIENGEIVGEAFAPSLSADGHRLAFVARDLSTISTPGKVYVRDNLTGTTLWVGSNYDLSLPGSTQRLAPQLSPDGRWVSLIVQRANGKASVILRDLESGYDLTVQSDHVRSPSAGLGLTAGRVWAERLSGLTIWDLKACLAKDFPLPDAVSRNQGSPLALFSVDQDIQHAAYVSQWTPGQNPTLLASPQVFLRDTSTDVAEMVSRRPDGSPGNQRSILDLALSPNSRWVAFTASDTDVVDGDSNRGFDVFLYDTATKQVRLISQHSTNSPAAFTASVITGPASISESNQILAFAAGDGTLVANDTNGVVDVFAQDLSNGKTEMLSRDIPPEPGLHFRFPRVTKDGRYAAFLGLRSHPQRDALLPLRLFTADLRTAKITEIPDYSSGMVLTPELEKATAEFANTRFNFSSDGKGLVYAVEDFVRSRSEIRIFDLETKTNRTLLTLSNNWSSINLTAMRGMMPQFSPDGRKLWFLSSDRSFTAPSARADEFSFIELDIASGTSTSLPGGWVDFTPSPKGNSVALISVGSDRWFSSSATFLDLNTRTTRRFPRYNTVFAFSGNGRYAVARKSNGSAANNLLVRLDTLTGKEIAIPAPFTYPSAPSPWVGNPILSADGRYIVFDYLPDHLSANDHNVTKDIYVRDVVAGTTLLISVNHDHSGSSDRSSSAPILAPDGRTVIFRSWATDLVSGHTGSMPNFYFLTLPTTDTDFDELPDDWEMAYFNTLDRDGSGDFDGDGHSDREELEAGTNPTNGQSVLRVLTLQRKGLGQVGILWAAVVGKVYAIQARNSATEGDWVSLVNIRATSTTQLWQEPNLVHAPRRFYRIVLAE